MVVRMCDATLHPTIIREKTSTMKQTYATPEQVGTCVRSITHSTFGAVAVKSAHQIGMPLRHRIEFGGPHPLAAADALDAGGPHQTGDLITSDIVTVPAGGLPQLAGAVDPVVVLPQRDHDGAQHCVVLGPHGRRAGLVRVVGARGHLHAC